MTGIIHNIFATPRHFSRQRLAVPDAALCGQTHTSSIQLFVVKKGAQSMKFTHGLATAAGSVTRNSQSQTL
jgi:hypothetical protein